MANTQALNHYRRVITTQRNGTCLTCGATTVTGRDFAAVTGDKQWHAYCATCAASFAAQAAGLTSQLEAVAAEAGEAGLVDALESLALPEESKLIAVIQATGSAYGYDVVRSLLECLATLKAALATHSLNTDPLLVGLRTVSTDANATPRDRAFAEDLVRYYDRHGVLTDRQRGAAERLVKTSTVTVSHQTSGPLEEGLYLCEKGIIRKVYITQNNRLAAKLLEVLASGKGSLTYEQGGLRTLSGLVAEGKAHKLSQEEASQYGRQYGFCVNCARLLNDDRSIAAGYGETCADNHGWHYPSKEEAAFILSQSAS